MSDNNNAIHSSFWANVFNPPAEDIDLQKALRATPLFKDLSKKDLSLLMNIVHNRNYVSGEYVFYQGDPGIGLYLIREGKVEIRRNNENILAIFEKGDFFGELALVDGAKRSASAITKVDARLAVIFKPDLDDFIEKYPKKGIKILRGVAEIVTVRLRRLNEDHLLIQSKYQTQAENNHGT